VENKVSAIMNKTRPVGNFSDIRIKGVSDDNGGGRINQYCVGSTVEIFSPTGYQARIIEDDSLHFGFRDTLPYNLRIIFTNGLTQNSIDPPKNTLIEEVQIPTGSCPFLYGWNGGQWGLITDLLWNAPLGLQYAKGKTIPDRRWENLLVPGSFNQPRDGYYELRVTEELWESAYFDQVALSYLDHPADVEVFSNEKVGPAALAEAGLWLAMDPKPLRFATDKYGRDWTSKLEKRDRALAIPFEIRICQGLVEEHWIEMDFGSVDASRPAQLYLTGWIYPTDTGINIGLDQNPDVASPLPPSLWTVGRDGQFRNAIPFTGFPGGKLKTIVIPLNGVFESEDRRIRIQHSSEIYWDQAFIAYGAFKPTSEMHGHLEMDSATLQYRGFSREQLSERCQPHWYDYNECNQQVRWPPMGGRFTRYGDVKHILEKDDDWIVVMGAGDEMRLRFQVPDEPVPAGYTRDFVMHNVGWDKDANLNTLEGQSSMPLPFSSMKNYPPPQNQSEEILEIERMHRATLTREQDFRKFWRNKVE